MPQSLIRNSLFILLLALAACGPDRLFESYRQMPETGWDKDSILRFEVEVEDSLSAYQIQVHFRHDNDYPFRNLYLFVNVLSPDQKPIRDTINIMLANPSGIWFGDGVGAVKHVGVILQPRIQFPMKGNYIFEFEHAMREEQLIGMKDLGLEIVKLEQE